jgi:SAM-dependent methyltransferase
MEMQGTPERGFSLTHEHIFSIVATELRKSKKGETVRILDVGCGDCRLMAYFHRNLPRIFPGTEFCIYGFDISESGVQPANYMDRAISFLRESCPGPCWAERVLVGLETDPWPFQEGSFDFIISNQVVEHVRHPDIFWENLGRALKDGGISVHLFPLKHYIYEGHLHLPFVHRIHHATLRQAYIRLLSRLGLGKFRIHQKRFGMKLDKYSEMHSDYINFMTNYRSWREVLLDAKRAQLRGSFRYTQEFYFRKLRDVAGFSPHFIYKQTRNALTDWVWSRVLMYLSSITLLIEKRQSYINPNSSQVNQFMK